MIFRCFNQKKREFDFTIITTASHKFLILYNFFFSAILSIQQFDFKLILFFFVCFSLSLPFSIPNSPIKSNLFPFYSIIFPHPIYYLFIFFSFFCSPYLYASESNTYHNQRLPNVWQRR